VYRILGSDRGGDCKGRKKRKSGKGEEKKEEEQEMQEVCAQFLEMLMLVSDSRDKYGTGR